MNKVNYSILCEEIIKKTSAEDCKKSLLLHVCCAPCASSVIEYLEPHFDLTLFFYNPNISGEEEFYYRLSELQRFIEERGGENFRIIIPPYHPEEFFEMAKGYENHSEGGSRCFKCYRQRLEATAKAANDGGFDYFTTTLTVSPYKNAEKLNSIGLELENEYNVSYLMSDFKKKNGYLRSIELSSVYDLYRQDFCGCLYSEREAAARRSGGNLNVIN